MREAIFRLDFWVKNKFVFYSRSPQFLTPKGVKDGGELSRIVLGG